MSYVLAADIGCDDFSNPWQFLIEGPDTQFLLHDGSIATFGRCSNTTPGSTTDVMQGWFAQQVAKVGWHQGPNMFYHSLYTTGFPGSFLPCCLACGAHISINGTVEQYNLGQSYLNNALAWTFLEFPKEAIAYQSLDPVSVDSPYVPTITNKQVTPHRYEKCRCFR